MEDFYKLLWESTKQSMRCHGEDGKRFAPANSEEIDRLVDKFCARPPTRDLHEFILRNNELVGLVRQINNFILTTKIRSHAE